MCKLLFFDIDATLCMPGTPPSQRTVEAIRSARAKGHKVFLSTGRNRAGIPAAVDAIGFDGYITNAGAEAQIDGQLLLDQPLSDQLTQETLDLLRRSSIGFIVQTNQGNYSDFSQQEELAALCTPESAQLFGHFLRLLSVEDLSCQGQEKCYKICFFAPDPARYEAIKPWLEQYFSITLFDNLFPGLPIVTGELNQLGINKGIALESICRFLQKSSADAIAFGDSTNDSDMLIAAGLGYAMENGQPEVKAIADRICPPCQEDGVAQTLEALGLA